MNDNVSDALIRIKNGYLARRPEVTLPYSKLIGAICELLVKAGYIAKFSETQKDGSVVKNFMVELKYESRKPALTDVKRVSKPGLRVYKGSKSIPYVLNGMGMAIVSTPKGVMSDKEARKNGVGGEVIALVW